MAAETKPRATAFQGREAMRAIIRNPKNTSPAPGFERVIGEDDMLASPPDQQAYQAGLPVARVAEGGMDPRFQPRGVGTGFLISDGILLRADTRNMLLAAAP